MSWHADFAFGCANDSAGIVIEETLSPQIAQERTDGGQFPRSGCARIPVCVNRGEKASDGSPVECRWREILELRSSPCGHMVEELRDVTPISARGVSRHIPVQAQETEEVLDVSSHQEWTASAANRR
jgi:hypothetical protein